MFVCSCFFSFAHTNLQALSPSDCSASTFRDKLGRGATLDAALDVLSLQGNQAPVATHVKDAKAADGNLTLAAACRKRNAGNNYEIPILDEAKRIKYNEYWQQYRMDQPPAPPAVAETPPAVPTPTAPSTCQLK